LLLKHHIVDIIYSYVTYSVYLESAQLVAVYFLWLIQVMNI